MAQTKRDKRVVRFFSIAAILGVLISGGLYFAFGVAGAVVGIFIVVVAFCLGVAWFLYFYRCPECGRRLRIQASQPGGRDPIRHRCEVCDIVWVSGIEAGSSSGF